MGHVNGLEKYECVGWKVEMRGVEDDSGEDMVIVSDGGMIWGLLR